MDLPWKVSHREKDFINEARYQGLLARPNDPRGVFYFDIFGGFHTLREKNKIYRLIALASQESFQFDGKLLGVITKKKDLESILGGRKDVTWKHLSTNKHSRSSDYTSLREWLEKPEEERKSGSSIGLNLVLMVIVVVLLFIALNGGF